MTRGEWIAGLLAAVFVAFIVAPRVGDSAERERIEQLGSQLALVRNAIQRYYHEHGDTYPGNEPAGSTEDDEIRFVRQLTVATTVEGVSPTGPCPECFGPYLKITTLPASPVAPEGIDTRSLIVVTGAGNPESDGTTAWRYNRENGRFIANQPGYARY